MKSLGLLICNFEALLKKFFLNNLKTDICHVSEKTYIIPENKDQHDDNDVAEYRNRYNSTTRWQTI